MANNILRGLIEETGSNTNGAQKRPRESEDEGPVKKYVCILYSVYIRETITCVRKSYCKVCTYHLSEYHNGTYDLF